MKIIAILLLLTTSAFAGPRSFPARKTPTTIFTVEDVRRFCHPATVTIITGRPMDKDIITITCGKAGK